MMNVDYIIVGCGLAGLNFCEVLKSHSKSFVVFDNNSQQSSTVAGGLYNPVILKRFTPVWKSDEQLELALPIYNQIESELNEVIDFKTPVYRRFVSAEEQNDWFAASDKPRLAKYLSTQLVKNENEYVDAAFGYGEVLHSGRMDTKHLIHVYKNELKKKGQLREEAFEYEQIQDKGSCSYKDIEAKHIVFAEGFGLKSNPFFKHLPLNGTKGELLTIHAPDLKIDYILKSSVFLIPQGDDLYRVGATYEWEDKSNNITPEAREELLNKLKTFLKCDFDVVDQAAGIRPTVIDRRPLVGRHSKHPNMYVLNGLGTRGVMIGPYAAKQLYNFIEGDLPLDKEINSSRFDG